MDSSKNILSGLKMHGFLKKININCLNKNFRKRVKVKKNKVREERKIRKKIKKKIKKKRRKFCKHKDKVMKSKKNHRNY